MYSVNIMLNTKDHALYLGKLVANLQGLEFMLRGFLFNVEDVSEDSFPQLKNLHDMNEGDTVHLNALTNYDTLYVLIKKYNSNQIISSAGLTIEENLVDVRDALAHGRVFIRANESPPFTLLKFKKHKRDAQSVDVEFSALMTDEWFKRQIDPVMEAEKTVKKAIDL